MKTLALLLALVVAAPIAAAAPPDYFGAQAERVARPRLAAPGERSSGARWLIGGLAAGAALSTVAGVLWYRSSHDHAARVEADSPTGRSWTAADAADREAAISQSALAIGAWVLASQLALAALIVEKRTRPRPVVVAAPGGVVAAVGWSF